MVSLVVILGAIHGIILLPVLLSIFGPGACTKQQPSKPEEKPAFQTDDECTKECNHKFYSHTLSQMDTQKQIKIPRPKSSVSTVTVHLDHDGSQQLSYVSQLTAEQKRELARRNASAPDLKREVWKAVGACSSARRPFAGRGHD